MSHYPISAKGPASRGFGDAERSAPTDPDAVSPLPPDIGPEAAVERVLSVLGRDQYLAARRLAREAARRFPDHARVRKIAGIFDPRGKAVARPGGPRQPDRTQEFEWLRHPPDWARGKWVALAGGEVVAADESLDEVERIVRSRKLPTRPLVHRIE